MPREEPSHKVKAGKLSQKVKYRQKSGRQFVWKSDKWAEIEKATDGHHFVEK
jgi:hypothetical protein